LNVDEIINYLIDNLETEVHLPGYNFCGPGTRIERWLNNERGINLLDEACRLHDMEYWKYDDVFHREKADKALMNAADKRMEAKDANPSEKLAAWIVSKAMKTKITKKLNHSLRSPKLLLYPYYKRSKKSRFIVNGVCNKNSRVASCMKMIKFKRPFSEDYFFD
jgi:hypothetical protein